MSGIHTAIVPTVPRAKCVAMNTPRNRRRSTKNTTAPTATVPGFAQQFEEMPDPLTVVEHLTIPGFIKVAPHRFHMDEIMRFGDKVARIAESLQVSYLTTIDRQLGQIRLFPVPLLTRVYQVMAAQFGWEPISDVPAIEDRNAETLRANERTRKRLEAVAQAVENPVIAQAMATVLTYLEGEAHRLRATDAPPSADAPPPLRTV